jgi:hypothetical protein
MNSYCIDLHFKNDPILNKEKLIDLINPTSDVYMGMLDLFEHINPKFIVELHNAGVIPSREVETFYTRKNNRGMLHRDTSDGLPTVDNDFSKLNFVLGGKGSLMNWYKPKPNRNILGNANFATNTNKPAFRYELDDVELIHSQPVGYPSLVQVGIPHDVTAGDEDRIAICIVPTKDNRRLTIQESIDLLKPFIK